MLESLLAAIARLETLQSQSWGMVIKKSSLKPTKSKPAMEREANLLTVTAEKGGSTVRFDPSLSDSARWELLTLDGAAPSSSALKAHQKRYSGRSQKMPIEQLPPVSQMVPKQSVQLVGEPKNGYQMATFTPHIKLPVIGDIAKKLVGRLWYHVEHDYIDRIVVQNDAKLSPVPGLSISVLHLGMRFDLATQSGKTVVDAGDEALHVVMSESELLVVGKKLIKSFEQISHYRYEGHWMPS